MRSYKQILTITTENKEEFLNLSYEVEEIVRRSMINDGLCVVYSQHTTSSVFLENDSTSLHADWAAVLEKIVPTETEYKVDYISVGSPHIKQSLLGASVTIPISDGKLDLGPRQFIMYGDFDGCREKTVLVKIIGE